MTEGCNMECSYCTRHKNAIGISKSTLSAACTLAFSRGDTAGISFFGGEPMLERELILYALEFCREKSLSSGKKFYCKMTTNGTLLDEEFILRAKKAGMVIGLSFDGKAQDICRRFKDGSGSFKDVEEKARLLLSHMPLSPAMMTVAPEAAHLLFESVSYLYGMGFSRIICTPAYGKNVCWTDESLEVLKVQLEKTAEFYSELVMSGKSIFFSPFDGKIRDCVNGVDPSSRCHLGIKQLTVAADGRVYPCTQFMGDEKYCYGNVFDGISFAKRAELAKNRVIPAPCSECELSARCTNTCGCLNRLETGDENMISPFQCSYERMLIEISDRLADRLYEWDKERFMHKFGKKG